MHWINHFPVDKYEGHEFISVLLTTVKCYPPSVNKAFTYLTTYHQVLGKQIVHLIVRDISRLPWFHLTVTKLAKTSRERQAIYTYNRATEQPSSTSSWSSLLFKNPFAFSLNLLESLKQFL